MQEVRLRFAPSPTGYLHIGGLRTALFNYLYARHCGGSFILRIEDTDRTRYVEGALENLLAILEWAGLEADEGPHLVDGKVVQRGDAGPYIQSQRVAEGFYSQKARELVEAGKAYYCFCTQERLDAVRDAQRKHGETPRYDGHCRDLSLEEADRRIAAGEEYVIRLKLPAHRDIVFDDAIKGRIVINTDELDDQVLIKSDGFPTYHFAVVLDDHAMGITHVVRGEEWISSTPKHVYLYECFGWEAPTYVHLPTVLGEDHKKLSKRNGDVSVGLFVERGYLKEALLNYIALLGWSPDGNEEIFSLEQLVEAFDFDRVSNTGGIFDVKKLDWMNGQYIKRCSDEELGEKIRPYLEKAGLITETEDPTRIALAASIYKDRMERLDQAPELMRRLFCSARELAYEPDAVEALSTPEARQVVERFCEKLKQNGLTETFANGVVKAIQKESGIKGKALWFPIRAAVVGVTSGPDFAKTLRAIGEADLWARMARVRKEQFLEIDA